MDPLFCYSCGWRFFVCQWLVTKVSVVQGEKTFVHIYSKYQHITHLSLSKILNEQSKAILPVSYMGLKLGFKLIYNWGHLLVLCFYIVTSYRWGMNTIFFFFFFSATLEGWIKQEGPWSHLEKGISKDCLVLKATMHGMLYQVWTEWLTFFSWPYNETPFLQLMTCNSIYSWFLGLKNSFDCCFCLKTFSKVEEWAMKIERHPIIYVKFYKGFSLKLHCILFELLGILRDIVTLG